MRFGKLVLAISGSVVGLLAIGLVAGGAGLLWSFGTQRSDEGFITSATTELSTDFYALTSTDLDLGSRTDAWFPTGRLATVQLNAVSTSAASVFAGIGPAADVDAYLEGVSHSQVTTIGPRRGDIRYRDLSGDVEPELPSDQTFWAASSDGVARQTVTWDLEPGKWTVVIMNADASPGVSVDAVAGAKTDLLVPVAVGLLIGGLAFGAAAAALLVLAFRRPPEIVGEAAAVGGFTTYPVHIEGRLDPELSRWKWLVKWVLVIPHVVVLGFLWVAFGLLTVAAGFAILFTGRYPKSIFEFNVGVMRWTWRVAYYSYSALGTDQYPPFSLAHTDYPARFDVAYPESLSRWMVLVKWWLLAIPHYLVVGLFTSGLVWVTTELNPSGDPVLQVGGGLISLLVVIAGLSLAFAGRYPQGVFDLVMGLNRWVYRVWAYAALMRDEYPPFRLDTGGSEPPPTTPPLSPRPSESGLVTNDSQRA